MKKQLFLIGLILLTVMGMSMAVVGASEYEVTEDHLYIYEIREFDEDVMDDTFVYDYGDIEGYLGEDAEVGAMTAWMITDVDEADDLGGSGDIDGWRIDAWSWKLATEGWVTDKDDFDDPDSDQISEISNLALYEDAGDYGTIITFFFIDHLFVEFLKYTGVPTPVDEWLGDLDFQDNEWDVNDRSISYKWDDDGVTFDEDFEKIYTWNSKGELQSYEEYGGGDLMYELRLQGLFSSIPGYELPLLLGIAGVTAIGIIYIITRRNR